MRHAARPIDERCTQPFENSFTITYWRGQIGAGSAGSNKRLFPYVLRVLGFVKRIWANLGKEAAASERQAEGATSLPVGQPSP